MTLAKITRLLYQASNKQRDALTPDERYALLQAAATLERLRDFVALFADKEVKD